MIFLKLKPQETKGTKGIDKADYILPSLSWVMKDGIRAAPRVLLNDGGANLSKDAESLNGVYITP